MAGSGWTSPRKQKNTVTKNAQCGETPRSDNGRSDEDCLVHHVMKRQRKGKETTARKRTKVSSDTGKDSGEDYSDDNDQNDIPQTKKSI